MSISIVLDSGVWHQDARVRVQESRVMTQESGRISKLSWSACWLGPGVALPQPELRTPEHQEGAPDIRPPGRRGRDPGCFAPTEALPEEGHAPHPQA